MANAYLTEQIVFEILLRLPGKTLLRCKAVCKSWLSIISSSYFVKTHISISTNDPHSTRHHILSAYLPGYDYFESHSVHSLLNEAVTEAIKIDNPIKKDFPGFLWLVVGCCNGLVCLQSCEPMRLFLWNPSTRKIRALPEFHTEPVNEDFGFCYDESSDDYKLFSIAQNRYNEQKVSVYSSKSNSWKSIGDGDFPFGLALEEENGGVFADGAVHWVARKQKTRSHTIVSVDIKKETFGELDLPTNLMDYWRTLDTFGKSLSVVNCMTHDIWILKERDVKESWTKVFTIRTDMQPIFRFNPLCICVNGDILLNLDTTIKLYNSKDKTSKILLHKILIGYMYAYVESLVSP